MKALKPFLILCAALCCATACQKEADMTVIQKTLFENADIREIEVNDGWQVTVVADSCTYVELAYSAYLEPYVKAKINDTHLELGFMLKTFPAINSEFRATVHLRQLEKIDAKTASKVTFTGSDIVANTITSSPLTGFNNSTIISPSLNLYFKS